MFCNELDLSCSLFVATLEMCVASDVAGDKEWLDCWIVKGMDFSKGT